MPSQRFNGGTNTDLGMDMHREELGSGLTSDPVIIGGKYRRVSVGVSSIGSTARIEYTLDPVARVEAGTADWCIWASGNVSVNSADNLEGPATAVRDVAIGGIATWQVNAAHYG